MKDIYKLYNGSYHLTIKDLNNKNLNIKILNDICKKFNIVFVYNRAKFIPENIQLYFKLKNLNIDIEQYRKLICINNYDIYTAFHRKLINDNDLIFLFKSFNYKYIINDNNMILSIYGNRKNINQFINYLNIHYEFNILYF